MVPAPAAIPNSAEPDDPVATGDASDRIETDAAHWPARTDGDNHRTSSQLADVAQLKAEIARLEHELERKEAHLDAVVTRNEQILAERTRSYQQQLAELDVSDGDDGVLASVSERGIVGTSSDGVLANPFTG